jgi:hypothetical protein
METKNHNDDHEPGNGFWRNLIYKLSLMNAKHNTPSEWRESVKTVVAGGLAIGCWVILGSLFWSQFDASRKSAAAIEAVASSIKGLPTSKEDQQLAAEQRREQVAIIKDAHNLVNQTASSIYVLITPVATAITGYIFVSSATKKPASATTQEADLVLLEGSSLKPLETRSPLPPEEGKIVPNTRLPGT